MTARNMKTIDLRRWNRVQSIIIKTIGIKADPDEILLFGRWFADQVDLLGRLPRIEDFREITR